MIHPKQIDLEVITFIRRIYLIRYAWNWSDFKGSLLQALKWDLFTLFEPRILVTGWSNWLTKILKELLVNITPPQQKMQQLLKTHSCWKEFPQRLHLQCCIWVSRVNCTQEIHWHTFTYARWHTVCVICVGKLSFLFSFSEVLRRHKRREENVTKDTTDVISLDRELLPVRCPTFQ